MSINGFLLPTESAPRPFFARPPQDEEYLSFDFGIPRQFIDAPGTPAVRRGSTTPSAYHHASTGDVGDLSYAIFFDVDRTRQNMLTNFILGTFRVFVRRRTPMEGACIITHGRMMPQHEGVLDVGVGGDAMGHVGPSRRAQAVAGLAGAPWPAAPPPPSKSG